MSFTSRTDRKPDPSVDRERALAALIFCARQHPDKPLARLVRDALLQSNYHAVDLHVIADTHLAAAFRAYNKENR